MNNKVTSEEEALEAVQDDGMALEYVPDEFKTEEVCLAAVQADGAALLYVPESVKTEEICLTAVTSWQTDDAWRVLKAVPEKFLSQDLCKKAVDRYAIAIEVVPEKFITEEMCISAVKQGKEDTGEYLSSIPENHRTKAVCLSALRYSHIDDESDFYGYIPDNVWHESDFLEKANCFYAPESLWEDADFCNLAVKSYYVNIAHVPEDLVTFELCIIACNSALASGFAVEDVFIESEYISEELQNKVEAALKGARPVKKLSNEYSVDCYGSEKDLNKFVESLKSFSLGFEHSEIIKEEGFISIINDSDKLQSINWDFDDSTFINAFKNIVFIGYAKEWSDSGDPGITLFGFAAANGKILDHYKNLIEFINFDESAKENTRSFAEALKYHFWTETYEKASKSDGLVSSFAALLQKKAEAYKKEINLSSFLRKGNAYFWVNYFHIIQKYHNDWTKIIDIDLFDENASNNFSSREWEHRVWIMERMLRKATEEEIEKLSTRFPEGWEYADATLFKNKTEDER